jgi:hypothetical protein
MFLFVMAISSFLSISAHAVSYSEYLQGDNWFATTDYYATTGSSYSSGYTSQARYLSDEDLLYAYARENFRTSSYPPYPVYRDVSLYPRDPPIRTYYIEQYEAAEALGVSKYTCGRGDARAYAPGACTYTRNGLLYSDIDPIDLPITNIYDIEERRNARITDYSYEELAYWMRFSEFLERNNEKKLCDSLWIMFAQVPSTCGRLGDVVPPARQEYRAQPVAQAPAVVRTQPVVYVQPNTDAIRGYIPYEAPRIEPRPILYEVPPLPRWGIGWRW